MPGLIDSHVHLGLGGLSYTEPSEMWTLLAAKNAYDTLMVGVTTVRNLGGLGVIGDLCLKKSPQPFFLEKNKK